MAENETTPKTRLAKTKDWVEFLSKLVPLLAGIVYVAGYLVTAQRLAEYNVSVTQLVNAQYFTAGMAPGIITCLMIASIYDALTYDGSKPEKLVYVGAATAGLFVLTLVLTGIDMLIGRIWKVHYLGSDRWFDFYVMTLLRLALGLTAIWYIVAGVRSRVLFKDLIQSKKLGVDFSQALQTPLYILIIGGASIVFCYQRANTAYARIPQAYGGGRPLIVRLYVERDKTPVELVDINLLNPVAAAPAGALEPKVADKSLVNSIPLKLIFQTSESLIVDSATAGQPARVWTLDADAVHAVLSTP